MRWRKEYHNRDGRMPRPKNSTNKPGHKAGGDRKSADFLAKKKEENEQKKRIEEQRKANVAARAERERAAADKREEELQARWKNRIEETKKALKDLSEEDVEYLFRRESKSDENANFVEDEDDDDTAKVKDTKQQSWNCFCYPHCRKPARVCGGWK